MLGDNLEDKTIYELVMRFNELMIERDKIDMEHNEIVKELYRRMPHLKDDVDICLIKRKELEKYVYGDKD